eukprot:UN32630
MMKPTQIQPRKSNSHNKKRKGSLHKIDPRLSTENNRCSIVLTQNIDSLSKFVTKKRKGSLHKIDPRNR